MSSKKTPLGFMVVQLSVGLGKDGQPVQYAAPRGAFEEAGPALELARELAIHEAARLTGLSDEEAEGEPIEVVDTEWGYDLRRGWLTITRFWVHDSTEDRPELAGADPSSQETAG